MTGRPGHWSEPGEYNILFLGSFLVVASHWQDSSARGYREFTQEGAMTISPFAAREGTSAPQWPNVKNDVVTSFRPVPSSSSHTRCRMVRIRSPAKLGPWSELTAKMVMGVVTGLVTVTSRF